MKLINQMNQQWKEILYWPVNCNHVKNFDSRTVYLSVFNWNGWNHVSGESTRIQKQQPEWKRWLNL